MSTKLPPDAFLVLYDQYFIQDIQGVFYGTPTIKFVEKEESLLTDEANHLQVREKRGR